MIPNRIFMAESLQAACRELRTRLGKRQEDFASEQGWRLNTVSRYELGRRSPNSEALRRYMELALQHGYVDLSRMFAWHIVENEGLAALPPVLFEKLPKPDELVWIAFHVLSILMRPASDELRKSLISLVKREEALQEDAAQEQRKRKGKR
jgi:transcriptional regulator with XRE-family HTH domain